MYVCWLIDELALSVQMCNQSRLCACSIYTTILRTVDSTSLDMAPTIVRFKSFPHCSQPLTPD